MTAPMPVWNRNFRRSTDLVVAFSNTEPGVYLRPAVAIGSRWQPTHAVVRDPDAGVYFERNPRMETSTELDVQRALLSQRANNRWGYWVAVPLLFVGLYFVCRAVWR